MYYFLNDYSEGAHPQVLKALTETNFKQTPGYGLDEFSKAAANLIKQRVACPTAQVHFLTGGTQTNLTALSSWLKPYQAVIAPETGHINVHETGAIEATGHKILTVATADGKLTPELIQPVLDQHKDEHMVQPKIVFISNSTELGTVYRLDELTALYGFCRRNNLYLYLDGARLGAALTSRNNDLQPEDLPRVTDAFYLGGTKNGALFGEALVIVNPLLTEDFRYSIKQRGGLLAKGRLLGVQYLALMQDDLYLRIALHANTMACKLQDGLKELGIKFLIDSPSNQIFPIFPDEHLKELSKFAQFEIWAKEDRNHTVVRLVTSWATKEEDVLGFLQKVKASLK